MPAASTRPDMGGVVKEWWSEVRDPLCKVKDVREVLRKSFGRVSTEGNTCRENLVGGVR